MLRGMQRMPAEIRADIDEEAGPRNGEIVGQPPRQQWLMRAVFRDMASDRIAIMNVKKQI